MKEIDKINKLERSRAAKALANLRWSKATDRASIINNFKTKNKQDRAEIGQTPIGQHSDRATSDRAGCHRCRGPLHSVERCFCLCH